MARIPGDHVLSELPDLTGISLEALPAASVPQALDVLDRVVALPGEDQQVQVPEISSQITG